MMAVTRRGAREAISVATGRCLSETPAGGDGRRVEPLAIGPQVAARSADHRTRSCKAVARPKGVCGHSSHKGRGPVVAPASSDDEASRLLVSGASRHPNVQLPPVEAG